MGYKIIDNYVDARRLYDEGLLWYGHPQPESHDTLFKYPVPWYYAPSSPFTSIPGVTYAVYLEE